jgi:hypothetical protein
MVKGVIRLDSQLGIESIFFYRERVLAGPEFCEYKISVFVRLRGLTCRFELVDHAHRGSGYRTVLLIEDCPTEMPVDQLGERRSTRIYPEQRDYSGQD